MWDRALIIIKIVSMDSGIPVKLLTSKGQTKNVVEAKHEIRRRLRLETDLSWSEINLLLGYAKGSHR